MAIKTTLTTALTLFSFTLLTTAADQAADQATQLSTYGVSAAPTTTAGPRQTSITPSLYTTNASPTTSLSRTITLTSTRTSALTTTTCTAEAANAAAVSSAEPYGTEASPVKNHYPGRGKGHHGRAHHGKGKKCKHGKRPNGKCRKHKRKCKHGKKVNGKCRKHRKHRHGGGHDGLPTGPPVGRPNLATSTAAAGAYGAGASAEPYILPRGVEDVYDGEGEFSGAEESEELLERRSKYPPSHNPKQLTPGWKTRQGAQKRDVDAEGGAEEFDDQDINDAELEARSAAVMHGMPTPHPRRPKHHGRPAVRPPGFHKRNVDVEDGAKASGDDDADADEVEAAENPLAGLSDKDLQSLLESMQAGGDEDSENGDGQLQKRIAGGKGSRFLLEWFKKHPRHRGHHQKRDVDADDEAEASESLLEVLSDEELQALGELMQTGGDGQLQKRSNGGAWPEWFLNFLRHKYHKRGVDDTEEGENGDELDSLSEDDIRELEAALAAADDDANGEDDGSLEKRDLEPYSPESLRRVRRAIAMARKRRHLRKRGDDLEDGEDGVDLGSPSEEDIRQFEAALAAVNDDSEDNRSLSKREAKYPKYAYDYKRLLDSLRRKGLWTRSEDDTRASVENENRGPSASDLLDFEESPAGGDDEAQEPTESDFEDEDGSDEEDDGGLAKRGGEVEPPESAGHDTDEEEMNAASYQYNMDKQAKEAEEMEADELAKRADGAGEAPFRDQFQESADGSVPGEEDQRLFRRWMMSFYN